MDVCGLERAARTGPDQIHVQAQSNPVRFPDWARTGQTGLARSNPVRAPAGLAIWVQLGRSKNTTFWNIKALARPGPAQIL